MGYLTPSKNNFIIKGENDMEYFLEIKRNKYWVTFIERKQGIDQKSYDVGKYKMVKFKLPDKIDGQVIDNNAINAKRVWDELFAWKYGQRVPGTDVMLNIQDLNKMIHSNINFVSLIEKPPVKVKEA